MHDYHIACSDYLTEWFLDAEKRWFSLIQEEKSAFSA